MFWTHAHRHVFLAQFEFCFSSDVQKIDCKTGLWHIRKCFISVPGVNKLGRHRELQEYTMSRNDLRPILTLHREPIETALFKVYVTIQRIPSGRASPTLQRLCFRPGGKDFFTGRFNSVSETEVEFGSWGNCEIHISSSSRNWQ
jgi:hypothetical protein